MKGSRKSKSADALRTFVKRAIYLGVDTLPALAALIPNPILQKKLLEAESTNPLEGRELSVDDLVQEMEGRAAEVLARGECESDKERCTF